MPIVHYTIVTPTEMTRNIVNERVAEQVKEHMGDIEHIVCPDKDGVLKSRNHSFFIVSLKALYYLLHQCLSKDEQAKEHLLVVYKAAMAVCNSTEQMTPTARVCVRVLASAYIQCKARDQDLAENDNWKQLESSLKEYFRKKVKDDTLRDLRRTQQSLLSASIKISRSNRRRGTGTNPLEHAAPLHSTGGSGTKRQRSSDLVDDQEPRDAACLMGPRSGGDGSGDTSEQNADGSAFDGSPDSVLPHCGPSNPGSDTRAGISRHSHPQDKLCHLVRLCSSILYKAHALGILSIDNSAMLVHVTHEGLIRDLKALCKRKNDEMQAATILSRMRGRK
jgi:hypothetical protein